MRQHPLPKAAWLAAVAIAALGSLTTAGARGEHRRYEVSKDFSVQVDGESVPDAKVFLGGGRSRLLVLPSQDERFLVDGTSMTVFAVREEDAVLSRDGATVLVKERFAWNTPLWFEGAAARFRIGALDVQIAPVDRSSADAGTPQPPPAADPARPPATTPLAPDREAAPAPAPVGPATAPAGPGPVAAPASAAAPAPASGPANAAGERKPARECVALESRPAAGVPGCTRFVYLRNTCEVPVVAQVQRTEHLMTGTLPESFTVTAAPGEQWLGCLWWSGAMAPAKHEILGAAYLEPSGPVAGGRHGTPPRR